MIGFSAYLFKNCLILLVKWNTGQSPSVNNKINAKELSRKYVFHFGQSKTPLKHSTQESRKKEKVHE